MSLKSNNFDFYELLYRDLRNKKTGFHVEASEDTIAYVEKAILELQSVEPKESEALKFSDVIYYMMPVADKDNSIRYEYTPVLAGKNEKADVREYINRFENFNMDNLPLIEVAKYLRIKLEKSNTLKAWGRYFPGEEKIIMGTDYEPVFIHELAHAIDVHSDNFISESAFMELVAESSVVALCKYYYIQNDNSASLGYLDYFLHFCLDHFSDTNIISTKLIRHVAEIFETVKFIKQDIKNGIYDIRQRAGI